MAKLGERRNRNREDGGGLAASGAVADSRRDAGDSRLWCPVIPGLPPSARPLFLLPRGPPPRSLIHQHSRRDGELNLAVNTAIARDVPSALI